MSEINSNIIFGHWAIYATQTTCKAVPNIIIPDAAGKRIDLSEVNSEKILILFYSSWCPHCQTMIPQIKELYDNSTRKELEVLAVGCRSLVLHRVRTPFPAWVGDLEVVTGAVPADPQISLTFRASLAPSRGPGEIILAPTLPTVTRHGRESTTSGFRRNLFARRVFYRA